MNSQTASPEQLPGPAFRFYRRALDLMGTSGIPYLVGGAYALGYYTGIVRHTKDFDLFVRPADIHRVLDLFAGAGYRSELFFSHWLGKVYDRDDFVDIIFSSGNGLCAVDDPWFGHAVSCEILEKSVRLIPAEEMIWQKGYIMERERFDGADVIHLIRARGLQLDWDRLLARFGPHWRVLLSHLVLFRFVYPEDRVSIPPQVLRNLTARLREDAEGEVSGLVCQGTLLSRTQYLVDTEEWGYADPRMKPVGPMTEEQVTVWTDAGR